jgi:hypothetical protein
MPANQPLPLGWVRTEMQCVICSRAWTAMHPPTAEEVACPDCGYVQRADQGMRL